MSISGGDAAEQVVRFSLEGMEMAVKLVGSGARELATFLYAALRDNGGQKAENPLTLKGRERLATMLKSGKELKVFALKDADLKEFCAQAKRYGVGYTVVRGKGKLDGLCDVMVPTEQAPMVARILERFGYQGLDRATLQHEAELDRGVQGKDDIELSLDEALGEPQKSDKPARDRPTTARSEPPSKAGSAPSLSGSETSNTASRTKPSVKERLLGIAAALEKPRARKVAMHQQPKARRKKKAKGAKVREL
jgi:hypothetical protein